MTYSITYPVLVYDNNENEFERKVLIEYTCSRGAKAVLYGDYPQPEEFPEIEIGTVSVLSETKGLPVPADYLTDAIVQHKFDNDDGFRADMIEQAREQDEER